MKSYEQWDGSKAQRTRIVDYILSELHKELFPELTEKQICQVFLEALCRNIVQAELREMMIYIVEEEKES